MQKDRPLNMFDVTLMTGRVISLSRHEVTRIFLHPWILLTYSGLSLMTVAMNQQPWTLGMPMWLRTAIYFLSSVFGLSVAWLTLIALSWAVTWRLIRRVHSIIFDLTGAFMSLFTTYWLVSLHGRRPELMSASSAFLYAFYTVIIVHVSIFLWSVVIPRILLQLRAQDEVAASRPIDAGGNAPVAVQEDVTVASRLQRRMPSVKMTWWSLAQNVFRHPPSCIYARRETTSEFTLDTQAISRPGP